MEILTIIKLVSGLAGLWFVTRTVATVLALRRVVPTNEVHIVQSSKKTTSYGKDTGNGNTYYELPSWLPVLGVTKITLPTSNFNIILNNYEAYDKGRLPFLVDVAAFFRVSDSNVAAQRITNFQELHNQLVLIVQGAVRSILANNDIDQIMQSRSTFGDQFTSEVKGQLSQWGVEPVKNMELMDLRDSNQNRVIANIMEKKKSHIEMESRVEVAKNKQTANIAEIAAQQEVDIQKQNSAQLVGLRTVENERKVAFAQQEKIQALIEQQKETKTKEMMVLQIENVRKTEILKEVQIIEATMKRDSAVLAAEGQLETKRKEAEGITLEGQARADAEKAMQLAPVSAQITLAQEIGGNAEYQKYLITIRQLEATQAIGMEQAKALEKAEVKIIANSSNPIAGVSKVMDLFSSRGGTEIGAMLEGLSQTDKGQALVSKLTS